jgi:hypothetical protein
MTIDELKGFVRTLAFGASIETQFKINEALALIDSLAAKAKSDNALAKASPKRVDPDSWNWLPTQRR